MATIGLMSMHICSLGCSTAAPVETENCYRKQETKDCAMEANINVSTNETESKQRRHLRNRLYDIQSEKRSAARKLFLIENDACPKTFAQLQERIAAGLYIWDKEGEAKMDKDEWRYMTPFDFITWRDPAKPADKAGYEAWNTKQALEVTKVSDAITINTPQEALKVLQAFEAGTSN